MKLTQLDCQLVVPKIILNSTEKEKLFQLCNVLTVAGSSEQKGSRQILQESSYVSSGKAEEDDDGVQMGIGLSEEEGAKEAILKDGE